MTSITFDTLQFVQDMQEAGMPEQQAKAEARVLRRTLESGINELATRDDIKQLRTETRSDIEQLRTETRGDIEQLRTEINGKITLLQWMVGLSLILSGGLIALVVRIAISLPKPG